MSFGGPAPTKCSHGVPFAPSRHCDECEIVALTEWLDWAEKKVKKDRVRLDILLARRAQTVNGESRDA